MGINDLKPVAIDWEDAGFIRDYNPKARLRPFFCTEIGFVLSQDKERVVIATSISKEDELFDIVIIPTGCVKKIRKLKEITKDNKKREKK
jgi:hypothetical protein